MKDFVYFADLIGIIAGILVLTSFIPQLHKAYKTKRMSDVSIYLMALIAKWNVLMGGIWHNKKRSYNNCH
jgi:uncharacterized protein with PQ loop repeat